MVITRNDKVYFVITTVYSRCGARTSPNEGKYFAKAFILCIVCTCDCAVLSGQTLGYTPL